MMSKLFRGYLVAGYKYFVRYIKHQKDKYDDGENIDKDKWITLDLNKYKTLCTEDKWLDKSPEEQLIMALYAELEKMKDTNIKLEKAFKYKGTQKGKTNKQVSKIGENKKPPKQNNGYKYACKRFPPTKDKRETKIMNDKTYNWCKWPNEWVEHAPEGK